MAKPTGRPAWFKMFGHQHALIESVPDETAGKALKAVFRYFCTEEMEELDPLAFAVFSAIKPYIDESYADFRRSSEAGKNGMKKRWGNKGDNPLKAPITPNNEAEAEAEADTETEGESIAAKPPTRPRFTPPTVDDVRMFCEEHGYIIDPQRFIDFYESNGWRVGKNPMKSWQAAVRSWNSREKQTPNKPAQTGGYSHGLDKLAQAYKEEFGE